MAEPDVRFDFDKLVTSATPLFITSYAQLSKRSLGQFEIGIPLPIRVDIVTRWEWKSLERKQKGPAYARRFIVLAELLRAGAKVLEAEAQKLLEKAAKLNHLASQFDRCEEIRKQEARRK